MSALVTPGNLGNEFDVGGQTANKINLKLGAGITKNAAGELVATIAATQQTIRHERFSGGSANGTTTAWQRECTVARISAGRWQVTFAAAHPDGINYHVSFGAEEPVATRDNPKKTIEQGSKTSTGFIVMLTTDDNGAGADVYTDQPWSFGVAAPVTVITAVAAV